MKGRDSNNYLSNKSASPVHVLKNQKGKFQYENPQLVRHPVHLPAHHPAPLNQARFHRSQARNQFNQIKLLKVHQTMKMIGYIIILLLMIS